MPPYFTIQSCMNDLVLDIEGGDISPGTKVIMYGENGNDNQLWYHNVYTGAIHSKCDHDYVLDVADGELKINPFDAGSDTQKFTIGPNHIHLLNDDGQVLDIANNDDSEGACVCVYGCHGNSNQCFKYKHHNPAYFTIQSCMNDLVLDIEGGDISPGTKVIMYGENGNDNQLWYHDIYTGAIRSKCDHDYVLDVADGDLAINPFDVGSDTQKFSLGPHHIHMQNDDSQVFDIAGNDDSEGARVCVYGHHGNSNQCWKYNYNREYFLIRSDLNGLVMDIQYGNPDEGTMVIMWPEGDGIPNQLWYEDEHHIIHSKLNDMVLDVSSGTVAMHPMDKDNNNQGFSFYNNRIINVNDPGQVVDIRDVNTEPMADMCMYGYNGQDNQHWSKDYV